MARAPGDIDPKALHAGTGKRRKRKLRDRPSPPAHLKADEPKSVAKLKRMPLSPGVMLEPRQDGESGWAHTAPHDDWSLWDTQLHLAFGSRSRALVSAFLSNLKRMCRSDWDDDAKAFKPNEKDLNAAIAFIADIQPQNAVEASLAAQMFAIQMLQLRLSAQAFNSGGMVMEKDVALASKLARSYVMQVEALNSLRGGKKPTRQTITVKRESHHHQHMHWHPGGGNNQRVPQATDNREDDDRTGQLSECRTLPCPGEVNGSVVSFPGHAERAVSPPRRQKPQG